MTRGFSKTKRYDSKREGKKGATRQGRWLLSNTYRGRTRRRAVKRKEVSCTREEKRRSCPGEKARDLEGAWRVKVGKTVRQIGGCQNDWGVKTWIRELTSWRTNKMRGGRRGIGISVQGGGKGEARRTGGVHPYLTEC